MQPVNSSSNRARAMALAFFAATSLSHAPAAVAVELVARGAVWSYLDDGSDQGTAWKEVIFPNSWASGPAQLGYGDGDEDTKVGFGPDANNKYITTYFRHTFTVADPGSLVDLTLRLKRDDGGVVYLNGGEVLRSNMPVGPIGYQTAAASTTGGAAENAFDEIALAPALLVPGDNVLAVEIHQITATSSDISLDLELLTSPPALVRGPYLQLGTPTSLTVRWRTDLPSDSWVRFGPAANDHSTTVTELGPTTEHEVEITGLTASTEYFYDVGSTTVSLAGGDLDHFFVTSPQPGTLQPTRIWVIGDSGRCGTGSCVGANDVADAYLSFVGGDLADVWLMLGDNAYNIGTENQYTAAVFDTYPDILRNTMLWPVPGNHEFGVSDSPSQTGPYYDAFSIPTAGQAGGSASGTEAYYSFDYGNVHFVALDSHDTSRAAPANPTTHICPPGEGGAMYQWLCADLAATDKDWVIAYWHHPPYTKGSHDSDNPVDSQGRMFDMRERFVPVLEQFGVDLQLTGHSHSYERSVLMDGHYEVSSFYASHVVDGGDGDPDGDGAYVKPTTGMAAHEGTVYSVVGSSSQANGAALDHPIMTVAIADLGSLLVDVRDNVLNGYWIDDTGLNVDHFRIVKGAPQIPALSPAGLLLTGVALLACAVAALIRSRRIA
jgi:hypothetical protein